MADSLDPFGGLNGDDRDVAIAINNTLKQYGLESLAGSVLGFIQNGYGADTIGILLQETPEYKRRFAGNIKRVAQGLPALSPSEYLSVETSYRQIMSAAGLPPGFYDEPSDFQSWIENDVAPTEVNDRVKVATDIVNNMDPLAKQRLEEFYAPGEIVAYALDRTRATTVLDRQWRAAQISADGTQSGLAISRQQAERVAGTGVSADQARAGVSSAAALARSGERLGQIYGTDYSTDDALSEVFESNGVARQRRRRLASQERGQFSGSAATTGRSLGTRDAGRV